MNASATKSAHQASAVHTPLLTLSPTHAAKTPVANAGKDRKQQAQKHAYLAYHSNYGMGWADPPTHPPSTTTVPRKQQCLVSHDPSPGKSCHKLGNYHLLLIARKKRQRGEKPTPPPYVYGPTNAPQSQQFSSQHKTRRRRRHILLVPTHDTRQVMNRRQQKLRPHHSKEKRHHCT